MSPKSSLFPEFQILCSISRSILQFALFFHKDVEVLGPRTCECDLTGSRVFAGDEDEVIRAGSCSNQMGVLIKKGNLDTKADIHRESRGDQGDVSTSQGM